MTFRAAPVQVPRLVQIAEQKSPAKPRLPKNQFRKPIQADRLLLRAEQNFLFTKIENYGSPYNLRA